MVISSVKRPPGPSWLELQDEGIRPKYYWSLDYPVKLLKKYGDIIYFSAFKQYLIGGPRVFEYILKTNHKNYQRNPFFYLKRMKPIFGDSILVTEGDPWKHRRKIALPSYNQHSIKAYIPTLIRETEKLATMWQMAPSAKINMPIEMNVLTLKIALKILANREFEDNVLRSLSPSIQFCNWYCSNAAFLYRFKPTFNHLRFKWHINKIDQFLLSIIQERRLHPTSGEDLLNLLLHAKNEVTLQPLTELEILTEFKTHIITGHETTGCGLSWMWYLLALHPHYQDRLETELKAVLNGRSPDLEALPNLPFTKAVILETFRLYPPIWSIPRVNIESDTIAGFDIPPQSQLLLHIYALHRNPHYWERPNEFYPERFLVKEPERHSFLYLPFGAGGHGCIASHFASVESTFITAILSQKIRFTLSRRMKVSPDPCISLRPKGGIWMHPIFR